VTGVAVGVAFLAGAIAGLPALMLAAPLIGARLMAPGGRRLLIPAMAVLLAVAAGVWRGHTADDSDALAWADRADAVRGRVVDAPARAGRQQRFVVAVEQARIGKRWQAASGRVRALAPEWPAVQLGDRVTLYGAAVPLADETASGRTYLRSLDCDGSLFARILYREERGQGWRRAVAIARQAIDDALARAAPGDTGAFLAGLVTGHDEALAPELRQAFRDTGTSHLTAVSGSNLAMVVTVLVTLGSKAGWRRRLAWQLVTIAGVFGYALLTGFQPPAARAAIVAAGAIFASRCGRRPDPVTLLVLAAALMVAIDPAARALLSFQLSFASALALALVLAASEPTGVAGWAGALTLATMAAEVATLPILLGARIPASPTAVLANALIGPVVELLFPLAILTALTGLVAPVVADALAVPAHLLAAYVFAVVNALAHVRAVPLPVGSSPLRLAVLAGPCAAVIAALGRAGRRWATRTMGQLDALGGDLLLAGAGAALGAAGVVALVMVR